MFIHVSNFYLQFSGLQILRSSPWLTVTFQQSSRICSVCCVYSPVLISCMSYHRVCNRINTVSNLWSRNCVPFRSTSVQPRFVSCYSIFTFLYSVLQFIIYLLVIVLSDLLLFTSSNYPFRNPQIVHVLLMLIVIFNNVYQT